MIRAASRAIAVLNISGRISDATALAVFLAVQRVEWDKRRIGGLILRICSEGGSLAAAQSIGDTLALLRRETGIPVAAVIEDMALSAGFYLALAADVVVAAPAANVGCVGAIIGSYDLEGLEQRLGIRHHVVKSGPLKDQPSLHHAPDAAAGAALQGLVDDIHAQFVEWIVARRKLARLPEQVADGRSLSGRQAHALGLIDLTGGMAGAVAHLAETAGLGQAELIVIETESRSASPLARLAEMLPLGQLVSRLLKL